MTNSRRTSRGPEVEKHCYRGRTDITCNGYDTIATIDYQEEV